MLQRFSQDPAPSAGGELEPKLRSFYSQVNGCQGCQSVHGSSSISWMPVAIGFASLKYSLLNRH